MALQRTNRLIRRKSLLTGSVKMLVCCSLCFVLIDFVCVGEERVGVQYRTLHTRKPQSTPSAEMAANLSTLQAAVLDVLRNKEAIDDRKMLVRAVTRVFISLSNASTRFSLNMAWSSCPRCLQDI
jgi:hypothetical protein